MKKLFFAIIGLLFLASYHSQAQSLANTDYIYQLMQDDNLTYNQVKEKADKYFKEVGTDRGTGYKQFQRWFYERQFHIDAQGFKIPLDKEQEIYNTAVRKLRRLSTRSSSWVEGGPSNFSVTTSWNPGVGRATWVAVHPSNQNKIYAATDGGGVWKSVNGGATWTSTTDAKSSDYFGTYHIVIDPNDTNTVYVALNSNKIARSTDAGGTWNYVSGSPSGVRRILPHPNNSNVLFVVNSSGVYKSTNGGTNFALKVSANLEDIKMQPGSANIMYASGGGSGTFYRSTDTGNTWTNITSGITNSGRALIGVSPANSQVVYVVQANGSVFGRLYKSTDGGVNFSTTVVGSSAAGTNYFGYSTAGTDNSGQAWYDMAIAVNPNDAQDVMIAGIICWRSTNGGTSFTARTAWSYPNGLGYNHADVHCLQYAGNVLYSGTDGGASRSTDNGVTWTNIWVGCAAKELYRLSSAKTSSNTLACGAQDNGQAYQLNGGVWNQWLGADGMDVAISTTNASTAIACYQNGGIYRTTTGGASYTGLSQPSSGNWVTPICWHPNNADTVYGGWTGIYRSSNQGGSWTLISGGTITGALTCLTVAPSNANYIYGSIGGTMYVTKNRGATWSTYASAGGSITCITVSPLNPERVFITTSNASSNVLVSNNAGVNWTSISSGLPALAARSVAVEDNATEGIYVALSSGIFYRDSTNPSWVVYGTGLPNVSINEVEVHKIAGKVRIATYGRGVWSADLNSPAPCGAPGNLSTSAITVNSATISWAAVSGAVNYTPEYKKSSAPNWTVLSNTSNLSVNLSGLDTGTAYDWRVKTNCSAAVSNYSSSSFTTVAVSSCNAPNVSVNQVTQSYANISWTAVSGATDYSYQYKTSASSIWTQLFTTTGTSLSFYQLTPNTDYDFRVRANCGGPTSSFSQVTFKTDTVSCFPISGITTSAIGKHSATASWTAVSGTAKYDILIVSAANVATTVAMNYTGTSITANNLNYNTSYTWVIRTNCGNNYFSTNVTSSPFTTLDTCKPPASLTSTVDTGKNIAMTWSSVTGAADYSPEYSLSGSGTWTSASTANTNYTFTGSFSGLYNTRVKTNCSNGNGSSIYTNGADVEVFCAAYGNNSTQWIDLVKLESINRTSARDTGGYVFVSSPVPNLVPGSQYTIKVSADYTGSKIKRYWAVYIDFDGDGDFADATEKVAVTNNTDRNSKNMNFTIPNGTAYGNKRMRVITRTGSAVASPCGYQGVGEVEDYMVNISPTPGINQTNASTPIAIGFTDITVYPNPTMTSTIDVKLSGIELTQTLELFILSVDGKSTLNTYEIDVQKDVDKIEKISLDGLPAGFYLINVKGEGVNLFTRFVKQ